MPEGALVRPQRARHGLVDDRNWFRACAFAWKEEASAYQPGPDRREIIGRHCGDPRATDSRQRITARNSEPEAKSGPERRSDAKRGALILRKRRYTHSNTLPICRACVGNGPRLPPNDYTEH